MEVEPWCSVVQLDVDAQGVVCEVFRVGNQCLRLWEGRGRVRLTQVEVQADRRVGGVAEHKSGCGRYLRMCHACGKRVVPERA